MLTTFSWRVCAGSLLSVVPLDFHGVDDMLGDPAVIPAVSGINIFGTYLCHRFTVLLWEIKRATDRTLSMLLTKIQEGICVIAMSQKYYNQTAKAGYKQCISG